MAIIQGNAKKSTATGGFYPKVINGSLRFNDDDVAYLSWTPTSAGNRKTWTFSCWVKRGDVSNASNEIFGTAAEGDKLAFGDSRIFWFQNGSASSYLSTSALFRDPSAWYHIVFALDTTQATPANRCKLWVNGESVAFDNNTTFPTQNYDGDINNTEVNFIGRGHSGDSGTFDGYLANVHFLNGIAATADDFGELKNGVWVAKDYEGLFDSAAETALGHANGFYLTFEDDTEVEAFNTLIWRGDSSTSRDITGTGFAPDFVWIKDRNTARGSVVFDVIRGQGNYLRTNETTQESTSATPILTAFNSDGFTLGNNAAVNNSNETYVAWGWKAGGAPTVDNSAGAGNVPTAGSVKIDGVNSTSALAGSIPATRLSASTTYGFSIIKWTGDGTLGHGLNQAPEMFIVKDLTAASSWWVWHKDLSNTSAGYLQLNNTIGEGSNTSVWRNAYPATATTIDVNTAYLNYSTDNYLAYCFHSVNNYSKFGSYIGDGTTDGSKTIDLGFDPALVIIKEYDNNTTDGDSNTASGNWLMWDATRDTGPEFNTYLLANSADAENAFPGNTAGPNLQKITNGFAFINNNAGVNGSGRRYIYAAFADTREAAFWLDQSGNDNDWQPVNLDHNDTVADSPTNNFATMNPFAKGPNNVLSEGNLQVVHGGTGGWQQCQSNFAFPNSGKWYCEFTIVYQGDATDRVGINVSKVGYGPINTSTNLSGGNNANIWTYFAHTGSFYNNGVSSGSASTFGTGDVIQVSFDSDTGSLYFGKNGEWQNSGNPTVGTGYAYTGLSDVAVGTEGYSSAKVLANFGQQPFKYDPPE